MNVLSIDGESFLLKRHKSILKYSNHFFYSFVNHTMSKLRLSITVGKEVLGIFEDLYHVL